MSNEQLQPNQTLFIQNLGESCKREDLRRLLYGLFSSHGKVLDVVVTPKMRGQAFVVFADLQASTAARRREEGLPFLGKRMRINYAKSESHATLLHNQGPEALYAKKLGLFEEKTGGKLTVSGAQKAQMGANKNKRADDSDQDMADSDDEDLQQPKQKKLKTTQNADEDEDAMEEESDDEGAGPAPAPATAAANSAPQEVPHHILFLSNLPSEITSDMITTLCDQFNGFTTVRYQSVSGTANVVFDNWQNAAVAKEQLDGFKIGHEAYVSAKFADQSTQ